MSAENFERAFQHLIDVGVVEKGTRAIDVWGEALWYSFSIINIMDCY